MKHQHPQHPQRVRSRSETFITLWEVLDFIKADKPWTPSSSCPFSNSMPFISKTSPSSTIPIKNDSDNDNVKRIAQNVLKTFPMSQQNVQKINEDYLHNLLLVEDVIMTRTKVGTSSSDMDGFMTQNSQYGRKALILLGSVVRFQYFKEFLLSFGETYFKSIIRSPTKEMPPKCWGAFELDHIKDDGLLVYKPKMTTWPFMSILSTMIDMKK